MSSEAITRNDLTAILNEVLPSLGYALITDTFRNPSSVSISAGTVGTYGNRVTYNCAKTGYSLLGAFVINVQNPGTYNPTVTYLSDNTVYVSLYRATGSAFTVSANEIEIMCLYKSSY